MTQVGAEELSESPDAVRFALEMLPCALWSLCVESCELGESSAFVGGSQ
jgi:hypothetical protein